MTLLTTVFMINEKIERLFNKNKVYFIYFVSNFYLHR